MANGDVWDVAVSNNTYTPDYTLNTNWQWPYYTYSYPTTIYKYQIQCPSCDTMNWLELDKITVCSKVKCKAKLKAVSAKADHEIEVS